MSKKRTSFKRPTSYVRQLYYTTNRFQVPGERWEYEVLQDTLEAIVLHTAGSAGTTLTQCWLRILLILRYSALNSA